MTHRKFKNGTVHVARLCANETCSDANQLCKTAEGQTEMTECTTCCKSDRCNKALIKGKSNASNLLCNFVLIFFTVILSKELFGQIFFLHFTSRDDLNQN